MKKAKILGRIGSVLEKKFQLKDNTLIRKVKDYAPDRIELEIGDEKTPDEFLPQAKIKRWDNEVNFSIRWKHDHIPDDPELTFKGKNVRYKKGKQSFQAYELDAGDIGEDGGLEIEIVLDEQPESNVFEFTLQTKELDFFYQPAFTETYQDGYSKEFEQEITVTETEVRGSDGRSLLSRPKNVVGSYAVYHSTKRDNQIGGKEYKTGKAFHIYRPKIIDKNGDFVYGSLEIDLSTSILRVIVPQDFLATAQYPVIVDPTFGYTSIASGTGYVSKNYIKGNLHSLTENASIISVSAYARVDFGQTSNFQFAIYDNSSSPILKGSTSSILVGSEKWYTKNFSAPFSLSIANYFICYNGQNDDYNMRVKYDEAVSGSTRLRKNQTFGTWPNPLLSPTISSNSWRFSIYATYEPAGSTTTTYTKSHTIDTVLIKKNTASSALDTVLKKQATDAVSIDTITIKKQSVSSTADTLTIQNQIDSVTLDTILVKTVAIVSTVDTLLIDEAVVSHAVDTILSKSGSINHATDTILVKQQEDQLLIDTIVKTERAAQLTADTFISQQSIVQTSTDTVLVKENEAFSTVDTVLYTLTQNELDVSIDTVVITSDILDSTTDTLVADHKDIAAQVDTFLIATGVLEGTTDTFILDRRTDQVSIDTLILAQKNKQATIDTVIDQASEVESFIDTLLILRVLAQSSVDTVLIKSRSKQSSIDTTLIKSELAEASIDTYILPAMSTIGTVYASIVRSELIGSIEPSGISSTITSTLPIQASVR